MPKNEQDDSSNSGMSSYAKYSALGFQMIVIIGGFTYAGYKIDESAHHDTQWVTAAFALIGVFISLYVVFRGIKSDH
jgi:ATP synthase protein I